jgi:hypothetical protein
MGQKQLALFGRDHDPRSLRVRGLAMAGHLSVCVFEDGGLSWTLGQLELSSRRMTFPDIGEMRAPRQAGDWLAECINSASLALLDSDRLRGH